MFIVGLNTCLILFGDAHTFVGMLHTSCVYHVRVFQEHTGGIFFRYGAQNPKNRIRGKFWTSLQLYHGRHYNGIRIRARKDPPWA
jgi:hypothetical protein